VRDARRTAFRPSRWQKGEMPKKADPNCVRGVHLRLERRTLSTRARTRHEHVAAKRQQKAEESCVL